ncbi:response regulator receiver protein [Calothrix sp. NIES-2100]|uniref:response regulator n=1 Tax=Calothrix sp. NIES-2100 TaxID=1954172 RepID=UPI000B5F5169|nr:response regulator receiver protein [Calothrix sp. NIES-2100]
MYTNNEFPTNFSSLQGLRVLVVDDNVDCCDLMTLLLQIYGVEVQTAFSVQVALEIFRQWQPDVLVSDLALPKEDGFDLIHQLRTKAGEGGEAVLAIAVTGYADEKMSKRALSAGFDMLFAKPLDFDEFLTVLACLVICQKSSYAIAQRILGHTSTDGDLSLEKQLAVAFPG